MSPKFESLIEAIDAYEEQREIFKAIAEVATDGFWDWKIQEEYELVFYI